MTIRRREALLGAAAAGLAAGRARAADLAFLARAAATEPPITWYESSPPDQMDRILKAFAAQYPAVEVRGIRLVAGVELTARLVQEAQLGTATADVATGSYDTVRILAERNLLGTADWAMLGVPAPLIISSQALATSATVHIIIYNKTRVPAAAAPRAWADLLDPRWEGRMGSWIGSYGFTQLAWVWGEDRTLDFVERLARQKLVLYRSQFTLAQAVGAGEIDIGVVAHHTVLPSLAAGAPIGLVVPDPVAVFALATFYLRATRSPNAAQLLVAWLASAAGAKAYDDATGRGIHHVYDTQTARLIEGRQISEWPFQDRERLSALVTRHSAILKAGGREAN